MRECGDNEIEREYWDKRQLVKKINLNSLYGAILNPGCRFFDIRIGQVSNTYWQMYYKTHGQQGQ